MGRHAAMTAKPPSIIDQYSMVERATIWRLVSKDSGEAVEERNQQALSKLVSEGAFAISNEIITLIIEARTELVRIQSRSSICNSQRNHSHGPSR